MIPAATLALATHAYAASPISVPVCPDKIPVVQRITSPIPNGWTAINVPVVHRFSDIEFLEGNLVDNGELVPETHVLAPSVSMYVWDLSGNISPLWIGCIYTNTQIELYSRLPSNTASCQETVSNSDFDLATCTPTN